MINVVELQKAINSLLESVHPRVFFQEVPPSTAYPYLVFDLPSSFSNGDSEVFILDVDGWDKNNDRDTGIVDNLMALADTTLNNYGALLEWEGGRAGLIIYRDSRSSLIEDDKKIKRRKYVYQVKVI